MRPDKYTMSAGELRHRVTLQTKTAAQDAHGGDAGTWAALATIWAFVDTPKVREVFDGRRRWTEELTQIRIRYRSDVTTTDMRVVYGSTTYDVRGIANFENRNRYLTLECRALT